MIDLKRLHNLYQTISPASLLEHEVPLVGFSQLERRGRTRTGAIEWVVTLGARTGERDSWWTSRSDAREIEALVAEQVRIRDLSLSPDCAVVLTLRRAARGNGSYTRNDRRTSENELDPRSPRRAQPRIELATERTRATTSRRESPPCSPALSLVLA